MKTTIDIPEIALQEVMRFTKARTKRDAVNAAISDYNRRQKAELLIKTFGTWEIATNDEIEAEQLRSEEERSRGSH